MNFLAHIFLSFGDDEISIGNFIADSIRGNRYTHLPEHIQKGIVLHRAIDTYTDAHPMHKKSSKRLHPNQGHYSRVVIDVFYDHFLAKNWAEYAEEPLETFVDKFYNLLSDNYEILPEPTKELMPYMIEDNWLLNYAHVEGIDRVLKGLYRRTGRRSNMDKAVLDLRKYYDLFESEFHTFFKDLSIFSLQKYKKL
jgi:acyl carrier protein phosphodiesterase